MLTFTIPPALVIGLSVSVILPLLVGLVTKTVTHAGAKAALLALLSAATGLLTEVGGALSTGQTYDLGVGLITALTVFLVGVGLHYGLYKPTGLSDTLQRVGEPTPPVTIASPATASTHAPHDPAAAVGVAQLSREVPGERERR